MKRIFPWLVLIAGTAALAILYPSFPERWPSHWNALGEVNGWTDKSPMGAGLPLVLAVIFSLVFELLAFLNGKLRNTKLPDPWPHRVAAANASYLCYIATLLNVFLSYLACTLPFGPPPVASIFLLVTGAIVYPAYDFARLSREMRAAGALPAGYRGGVYNNPDDPRIWVPKLSGQGWTLNFAHGRARWIMAALLLLPLILVATTLLIARSAAGG